MNKYQEAIDYLNSGNLFGELSNDALGDIEELVDKAMPIRPKITLNNAYCGKCGEAFGYERTSHANVSKWTVYCPVCGQKQDWSEDE